MYDDVVILWMKMLIFKTASAEVVPGQVAASETTVVAATGVCGGVPAAVELKQSKAHTLTREVSRRNGYKTTEVRTIGGQITGGGKREKPHRAEREHTDLSKTF